MSVYFAIYFEDRNPIGKYPEYGFWYNYYVYEMPEYLVPKLNLQNVRIVSLTKEVASAWMFAGCMRDHIKVPTSPTSLIRKQMANAELVPHNEHKDKYILTQEDFRNATEFMKAIMLDVAHRGFEQAWHLTKPAWSKLYKGLPEAQDIYEEYLAHQREYGARLLTFQKRIEACTTVQECENVLGSLQIALNPANYDIPDPYGDQNVQRSSESEAQ